MITNKYLSDVASRLSGSIIVPIPSYFVISSSEDLSSLNVISSIMPGEYDRNTLSTPSATGNIVKYTGYRYTNKATANNWINGFGLFPLSSGADMQTYILIPSILHTSTYDLIIETYITFNRV